MAASIVKLVHGFQLEKFTLFRKRACSFYRHNSIPFLNKVNNLQTREFCSLKREQQNTKDENININKQVLETVEEKEQYDDYYGIQENDDTTVFSPSSPVETVKHTDNVDNSPPGHEIMRDLGFGTMRLDTENRFRRRHRNRGLQKLFDTTKEQSFDSSSDTKSPSDLTSYQNSSIENSEGYNHIDAQYFPSSMKIKNDDDNSGDNYDGSFSENDKQHHFDQSEQIAKTDNSLKLGSEPNYIDAAYFNYEGAFSENYTDTQRCLDQSEQIMKTEDSLKDRKLGSELNYIDAGYFNYDGAFSENDKQRYLDQSKPIMIDKNKTETEFMEEHASIDKHQVLQATFSHIKKTRTKVDKHKQKPTIQIASKEKLKHKIVMDTTDMDTEYAAYKMPINSERKSPSINRDTKAAELVQQFDEQSILEKAEHIDSTVSEDTEEYENLDNIDSSDDQVEAKVPVSAHDKLDSKGFRNLKTQVPDYKWTSHEDMANILLENIVYNNNDIVAISKPYGLPSQGGAGVDMSVGQLLPILANKLGTDKLHLIHRLDKETTGVLLLARTGEMALKLRGMFKRREVTKVYWCITKGVPDPTEGIIDIPVREERMPKGKYRMRLNPYRTSENQILLKPSSIESKPALTHYKVLSSHGNAALVECRPESGLKHQVRLHLAMGLNTPILGDHKYSHVTRIAPQKLPPDMLQKLGIRQAKARHVPMHLHAKTVVLSEIVDGKNIFVAANLPEHFLKNKKRLKIKLRK